MLATLALLAGVVSLMVGPANLSPARLWAALAADGDPVVRAILLQLRVLLGGDVLLELYQPQIDLPVVQSQLVELGLHIHLAAYADHVFNVEFHRDR